MFVAVWFEFVVCGVDWFIGSLLRFWVYCGTGLCSLWFIVVFRRICGLMFAFGVRGWGWLRL